MRPVLVTIRCTASLAAAVLLLGPAVVGTRPAVAQTAAQGGCTLMQDPTERATCEARQRAQAELRKQAREQVQQQREAADKKLDRAWQDAVKDARKTRLRDLVNPRLLALVVGLIWFWVALGRQRRRRQRR